MLWCFQLAAGTLLGLRLRPGLAMGIEIRIRNGIAIGHRNGNGNGCGNGFALVIGGRGANVDNKRQTSQRVLHRPQTVRSYCHYNINAH